MFSFGRAHAVKIELLVNFAFMTAQSFFFYLETSFSCRLKKCCSRVFFMAAAAAWHAKSQLHCIQNSLSMCNKKI